jgi:hypothetical protein
MKITVAGQDRTAELGPRVDAAAARARSAPLMIHPQRELSARSLLDAATEEEYLDRFVALVRRKHHADTFRIDVPRRRGAAGAALARVRLFLWKLLRYQHDRMAFQQNLINSQLAAALEFERDEVRKLRSRVAELERRAGGGAG